MGRPLERPKISMGPQVACQAALAPIPKVGPTILPVAKSAALFTNRLYDEYVKGPGTSNHRFGPFALLNRHKYQE